MRRYGQFMLLVAMVSIIALGCLQATAVQGEEEEEGAGKNLVALRLYFVDETLEGLLVEEREIEVEDEKTLPYLIVKETLKGPLTPELDPVIPEGTRLLGIQVEKGKATVNLSAEVRDRFNLGAMGEGYIIFSLVNALTELPEIQEVQFLVEGQVIESIGGHFLLEEPFARDKSLIVGE